MEQIGEGGMGLVFVAEQQQPVRRKVALKVIKPGMDTRDVIARFEAERQALALMDHPNIARVLDAGATESGRPYFVMELVKGVPITDYCDQNQLTPRERLELFVQRLPGGAARPPQGRHPPRHQAVQRAGHAPRRRAGGQGDRLRRGQGDRPEPHRQDDLHPLRPDDRHAALHEPRAGGDERPRTWTRAATFTALGVLLYELLTGTTPFDRQRLQKAAFDEIRRIIREEEPPKPSTRLSTLGATLSAVSARRKTEPRKLSALVQGDLDWIVMKALEKDRNRRYETASAFAADVRRYLGEEPIEARPPSALYRFGKYARRHRTALVGTALFVALMLAGSAVSTWLAVEARRSVGEALTAKSQSDDNAHLANEAQDAGRTPSEGLPAGPLRRGPGIDAGRLGSGRPVRIRPAARTAGQRQAGGRPARF